MPIKVTIAVGAILTIAVVGLLAAFQPAVADRFGYARPVKDGLPSHFVMDGIVYESLRQCGPHPAVCAPTRGAWLEQPHIWASIQFLAEQNLWPLAGPIATIPTLFGEPHDVFQYLPEPRLNPVWTYVQDGMCYVPYIRAEDAALGSDKLGRVHLQ